MDIVEPGAAPVRERIPVLDLGPFLSGRPGAMDTLAAEIRRACEDTGFFLIENHGVPQALIDQTFAASARFFALDDDSKLALRIGDYNIGYMPSGQQTVRTSTVNKNTKPNLNESFYITRERTPDDPEIVAKKPFIGLNRWPPALPEFRTAMIAYYETVQALGHKLVPVVARSLGLPDGYFDEAFENPANTLRLIRYQPQLQHEDNSFGFAPHTDGNFLSFLAQSNLPGLEVLTREGEWIKPRPIPGTFVVNTGVLLTHWSNDRYVATPHRVVNRHPEYRYAIPFFFGPNLDYPIKPVETCVSAEDPPHYEPMTYGGQKARLVKTNFAHRQSAPAEDY